MAIPAYLASSFSYRVDRGVTDVADVIVSLRDELLNQQSPAWTEPVSGTFKSPPDVNGRYFEFDISALSTTRLEMVLRDDAGREINDRTADITAIDTVRLYTGQFHCMIEMVNISVGTTGEALGCGVTDLTPDASDAVLVNTWMVGRRNSAGTLDANMDECNEFEMVDNGSVAAARRIRGHIDPSAAFVPLWSHTGRILTVPVELNSTPKGSPHSTRQPVGVVYQHLMVDDEFGPGDEVTVPIDDALVGTFKVSVRSAGGGARTAWRIG